MAVSHPHPSDQATSTWLKHLESRTHPQKVYILGLEQIIAGQPIADQNFAAWRYLVDIAPDFAAAGEVNLSTGDKTLSFAGLSYGPQLLKAVRAAEKIYSSDIAPAGDYELAILRIPGLLLDAFWLRSPSGGSDYVVPYDTVIKGLQEMIAYGIGDFLNIIRPLAKKRLDDVAGL